MKEWGKIRNEFFTKSCTDTPKISPVYPVLSTNIIFYVRGTVGSMNSR